MASMQVFDHQLLSSNLSALFWHQLKSQSSYIVVHRVDYYIQDDTVISPDLLIVRADVKEKAYLDFPPALICEVLSPSTALKDRHTKFHIYQSQKVPYYIIISPVTEEVEIYTLKEGVYVLTQKGRDLKSNFEFDGCKASIDFEEIW